MNDIDVVYTMWDNLHKTDGMEVGQVSLLCYTVQLDLLKNAKESKCFLLVLGWFSQSETGEEDSDRKEGKCHHQPTE